MNLITATGKSISLLDPDADQIDIVDIATALSRLARFSGHTKEFYSVAQHSVFVADLLPLEARAYGLLHDAHEAYLGDITRPVHHALKQIKANSPVFENGIEIIKAELDVSIYYKFGIKYPIPSSVDALVRHADSVALATEKRDVLHDSVKDLDWDLPKPSKKRIKPLEPRAAYDLFMTRYRQLFDS